MLFPYEHVPGNEVHPKLANRENVPVPAKQIRAWAQVPEGCAYATLSKEIEDFYPPVVREVCVRYVKDYPHVAYYGSTLLLVGRYSNAKARKWAASAVINEITMRFHEVADVTSRWLGQQSVAGTLALRDSKQDSFLAVRAKLFDTKLLYIHEPQQFEVGSPGGYFLADLFQHRWDRKLPTIVTMSADTTEGMKWEDLYPILGPHTAEMLRDTCHGYFARY